MCCEFACPLQSRREDAPLSSTQMSCPSSPMKSGWHTLARLRYAFLISEASASSSTCRRRPMPRDSFAAHSAALAALHWLLEAQPVSSARVPIRMWRVQHRQWACAGPGRATLEGAAECPRWKVPRCHWLKVTHLQHCVVIHHAAGQHVALFCGRCCCLHTARPSPDDDTCTLSNPPISHCVRRTAQCGGPKSAALGFLT
jgi:hypothetical protein